MLGDINTDQELCDEFTRRIKHLYDNCIEEEFLDRLVNEVTTPFAEACFEEFVLKPYPYEAETPINENWPSDGIDNYFRDMKAWLAENISDPNSYIAEPQHAAGKYKDKYRCVYFKNQQDAFYFKMVWG